MVLDQCPFSVLPNSVTLVHYWLERCKDGVIPHRSDIDPTDLKAMLPWLMIVEASGAPSEYRVRLAGTGLCAAYGADLTGTRFADIQLGWTESIFADCEVAVQDGVGILARQQFRLRRFGGYYSNDRVLLPLRSATGLQVLAGVFPEQDVFAAQWRNSITDFQETHRVLIPPPKPPAAGAAGS